MALVCLSLSKVAHIFQKQHKRVAKTVCVKEDKEEATNANEDEAKLVLKKKHKVTSNSKQTTPCGNFGNTNSNEQLELEPFTPSTQNTNLVTHPTNHAPSTSTDYDTSDEMYKAT